MANVDGADRVNITRVVVLDSEDVKDIPYAGYLSRDRNPVNTGGRLVFLHRGDAWVLNNATLYGARTKKDGTLYNEQQEYRTYGIIKSGPLWDLILKHWPKDTITITYTPEKRD